MSTVLNEYMMMMMMIRCKMSAHALSANRQRILLLLAAAATATNVNIHSVIITVVKCRDEEKCWPQDVKRLSVTVSQDFQATNCYR